MTYSIFPRLTASRLQVVTYLFGIALFSIAFLVFLNSSISFVVTDIIGQKDGVGDTVGTLGFADELLALVACPVWGLVSDRIGVRTVAVFGYCIVGASLVCLVQSKMVYPDLLLARLAFSVGAAACTTMVTAVLPAMIVKPSVTDDAESFYPHTIPNGHAARLRVEEMDARRGSEGHVATPSVSSELTITQTRYRSRTTHQHNAANYVQIDAGDHGTEGKETSQLAGFVGMFTGAGALVALAGFLPLPAYFQSRDRTQAESLQYSFYLVASIAFVVAILIFFGLRHLPGEEEKQFSALFSRPYDESTSVDHEGNLHTMLTPAPSYFALAKESVILGFVDRNIGLGYVGGFVARASSVAISLFIPFFVNAYFKRTGLCPPGGGNTLPDIRKNCQDAYKLAAALGGIAETAALLCAPIFGFLGAKVARGKNEWPLLASALIGIGGYVAFGMLKQPDPFHGEGGQWAIVAVVMIGISQIGSIVCSLGMLGRGTQTSDLKRKPRKRSSTLATIRAVDYETIGAAETAPLLASGQTGDEELEQRSRAYLKGSIAGIYSFGGGAGILILTKLGGALSDVWQPGAPFFIMAIFNAILLFTIVAVGLVSAVRGRQQTKTASTQTGDNGS